MYSFLDATKRRNEKLREKKRHNFFYTHNGVRGVLLMGLSGGVPRCVGCVLLYSQKLHVLPLQLIPHTTFKDVNTDNML